MLPSLIPSVLCTPCYTPINIGGVSAWPQPEELAIFAALLGLQSCDELQMSGDFMSHTGVAETRLEG